MAIRERNGKWSWRFVLNGREWSGTTDLAATKRNASEARGIEADARRSIKTGKADQLRLKAMPFIDAAEQFIEWAMGEHRNTPNTWKRLRGSSTSLKVFFQNSPIHSISVGQVEDFKAWRRSQGVVDVTIRHDMHCLSPIFDYAAKHHWCAHNPVKEVAIPSDEDAVRFHLVKPAEEMVYFATAQTKNPDLRDVTRVMLLQGMRPSEVMAINQADVNLTTKELRIPRGKSKAARRTLHLTPESVGIIQARILATGPSGWIFPGKKPGTHLVNVENGHKAVLKTTGFDFVIYDFRHTFATRMAASGCDIATLAAILGHGNLRTVQRYIHIGGDHMRAAMIRFGQGQDTTQPRDAIQ